MKIDNRPVANWLVSAAVVLALLVAGRPLLVPFIFAVLLLNVLNALTSALHRIGLSRWLAWVSSLVLIGAALYLVVRILGDEATALASTGPLYIMKLEALSAKWATFLHLSPVISFTDLASRYNLAGTAGQAVALIGNFVFQLALVAVYAVFLLSEQRYLPAKIAKLTINDAGREEGKQVIHTIARQVQAYLGVCTLLSVIMAAATYAVLTILGVDFAGFWSLVMFLLTYIPTVGTLGVVLPALMALVQFGDLGSFLIVIAALGLVHFVLVNIAQPILLGRSLNLSPFAIILCLTFWGLIWGAAGLFLAVPITAAIAIVCEHIEGLQWVAVVLAGATPKHARESKHKAPKEHAA